MIKNSISKIYNDIRQSGYAPPVWKRAQVPGLKESRLTIRGDEDRGLNVCSFSNNTFVPERGVNSTPKPQIRGPAGDVQLHWLTVSPKTVCYSLLFSIADVRRLKARVNKRTSANQHTWHIRQHCHRTLKRKFEDINEPNKAQCSEET